jgi:hypothetical protein
MLIQLDTKEIDRNAPVSAREGEGAKRGLQRQRASGEREMVHVLI